MRAPLAAMRPGVARASLDGTKPEGACVWIAIGRGVRP